MNSINQIQDDIIDEFSILGNDPESMIYYIMEIGQNLGPLDDKHRIEENLITGCQSKVWLVADVNDDKLEFNADSNTDITKGLISLLIRVLSGQKIDNILNAELYFIDRIGMSKIIGSQRSNGLTSMIKQIKLFALAYKTKLSNKNQ